jgi:hypothetical protein
MAPGASAGADRSRAPARAQQIDPSATTSSFKFLKAKRTFKGRIARDDLQPLCMVDRDVVLKLRKKGKDPKKGKAVSNSAGRWSIKVGKKAAGAFYAMVKKELIGGYGFTVECSKFRTKAIRIKARS